MNFRRIFTFCSLIISAFVFAQTTIPQASQEGILVLKNNSEVPYRDLRYENGKITYINAETNATEFVYDASVVAVKEGEKTDAENPAPETLEQRMKKADTPQLRDFLLATNDPLFIKGKKTNNTGTAFLAGGAACFVVGGILNLSAASKNNVINGSGEVKSNGTPVPLILGLAGMGAGLIMKISGHSQMRKSVNNYKNSGGKKFVPVFYVQNNENGLGLKMLF